MAPVFSSIFWALTVFDIHFCIWKMWKFVFMGSPFWSILFCKMPEFWRWKLWDQNFVPFDSGNIRIRESKEPIFTFLIELRTRFVWSHGLKPLRYNHGQNIIDKITKLNKIGFCLKCFIVNFWQFLAQLSNLVFVWAAGNFPSIPDFSWIFLKFPNFLRF